LRRHDHSTLVGSRPKKQTIHPARAAFLVEAHAVFEKWMKEKLAPMTLRLALGLVCVYHGYLKIMASGGTAWNPAWPVGWQLALAWGEFCAGVAILVGFRCRLAAAVVLAITLGTFLWQQGWSVWKLPINTLEPILFLLLIGLSLLFLGAGELSVDGRGRGRSFGAAAALRRR
jgi:uncharacterized membrane protein YphA (DoxX/SURF4 family)